MSRRAPEYHKRGELTAEEKEAKRIRDCDKSNRYYARKKLARMSNTAALEQALQDDQDIAQRKTARRRNREKRRREEEAEHEEDVLDAHAEAESARRKALLAAERAIAGRLAQDAVQHVSATYASAVLTPGRMRDVVETAHNELQAHKAQSKVIQQEGLFASRKKLRRVQELLPSNELVNLVAAVADDDNARPEGQAEASVELSTVAQDDSDEHDTSLKSMEGEDEEMRDSRRL